MRLRLEFLCPSTLDLAQRFASPALGLIATGARLNIVFLTSAVTVLCAAIVASWLMRIRQPWKKARNEPCFGFIASSGLYCWSRSLTVDVGTTVIAARGKARAIRS
jgi:hypothetical protein